MTARLRVTAPFAYRPIAQPDKFASVNWRQIGCGLVDEGSLRLDAGNDVVNHLLAQGTLAPEAVQ